MKSFERSKTSYELSLSLSLCLFLSFLNTRHDFQANETKKSRGIVRTQLTGNFRWTGGSEKCLNKVGMHVGHGEARRDVTFRLIYALAAIQQWRGEPATTELNFAGFVCTVVVLSSSSSFDRGIGCIPTGIKALPDSRLVL